MRDLTTTLVGRWAAEDVRTLLVARIDAGDDGRTLGFWDRRRRDLELVPQHTYLRQAATLAADLAAAGALPGQPVVVDATTPRATLLAYAGAVLAGTAPVITPVHLHARASGGERAAELANRLGAAAVLTDRRSASGPLVTSFDPVGTATATRLAPLPAGGPRPDDPLHLQLTSGSTSAPKAAVVTHANALANCQALSTIGGMGPLDATVSWLPLYHDMGLVGAALLSLLQGTDLHLLSPFDFLAHPEDWLRAITATGAAVTASPTFGFRLATERVPDEALGGLDLSCIRIASCGAEPVRPDVLAAFARRFAPCGLDAGALRPCYGLAEGTLAVTYARPGGRARVVAATGSSIRLDGHLELVDAGTLGEAPADVSGTLLVSAGTPVPRTEVAIVDPRTGVARGEGLTGEVAVRGPGVIPGYWEGGGVAPRGEEWLRTGDIGLLHGGDLFLLERTRNVIIRNGQNHAAAALENALAAACGLDADAVMVVDRDINDPASALTGVIEAPRGAVTGSLAEAAAAAGRMLDLPLDDVIVVRRGALPRTTSGKKQHAELRQVLRDGTLSALDARPTAAWGQPAGAAGPGALAPGQVIDLRDGGDPAELRAIVLDEVAIAVARAGTGAAVHPGALLHQHLGLESLALFELAVAVEERCGRAIGHERLTTVRTVDDLVAAVMAGDAGGATLAELQDRYLEAIPQVDVQVDAQHGRALTVAGRHVADFASCNYLGLDLHPEVIAAIDPLVRRWGVHPSWTRAVASPAPYRQLEARLADLVGAPDVVLFPTVSLLHLGVLPALAGPGGALLIDEAAHHSIQEAAELAASRGAAVLTVRHGDRSDLEAKLRVTAGRSARVICLDGVYSMSGDLPDLSGVVSLAEEWDATVYVDDAHGFGILGEDPTPARPFGRRGNGVRCHLGVPHARIVYVAGLSKAYSSLGAFVTCRNPEERRRYMGTSTMVFSGPVPTASLASALAGLDVNTREGDGIRARLHALTTDLAGGIRDLGLPVSNTGGFPILTVTFGDIDAVTQACRTLWDHGVLITPAVFPAVPLHAGGVRFSVTAANTGADVERALTALAAARDGASVRRRGGPACSRPTMVPVVAAPPAVAVPPAVAPAASPRSGGHPVVPTAT